MLSPCLLLFYCNYDYYSPARSVETFPATERRSAAVYRIVRILVRFLGPP